MYFSKTVCIPSSTIIFPVTVLSYTGKAAVSYLCATLLLKGELLEALPKNEQPDDPKRIALGGIDRKLRVECRMEDIVKLTEEEADLLLAISSATLRYQMCFDRKRLDFGKRLEYGSQVLVSINGFSKKLPGMIWFKGELPSVRGTMFGIELHSGEDGISSSTTQMLVR
ncbi:uncharacterized protein LOC122952285 [Acropora millepora]|uniref:uncharacterized protein LOC122952285 n=1 Tax=Acropora millepora TaxID=45264 RepID=UPI001CF5E19B|nr:uncharacterized protein LOC122952285 [Acropora millepora]